MSKTKTTSVLDSPTPNPDAAASLRELVFEISDVSQMKLLFAVAESASQKEFNRTLVMACTRQGIKLRVVEASQLNAKRALSFLTEGAGKGSAISVIGLSKLSAVHRRELFESLNFHRDAILRLPLGLILWIPVEEMYELAKQAPDLWSRRTGIFHLETKPAQVLIDRLFANSPIPRETWSGKDALAECLEILLSKEEQLKQCQTITSEVGVSRAKEAQIALLEASERLLRAASSERKIELSLWLWNLAAVDSYLRDWLSDFSPAERHTFESMYLDRNEVLLSLAEMMPEILGKYRDGIKKNIGKRKPASLLFTYIDYADKELNKITAQLHFVNNHQAIDHAYEYGEALPRSLVSEVATTELEKWLSGVTKTRPRYLNPTEGDLLKALYLGKPILEEANRFGASEDQILHLVEVLEKKMRVILGGSSRMRKKTENLN